VEACLAPCLLGADFVGDHCQAFVGLEQEMSRSKYGRYIQVTLVPKQVKLMKPSQLAIASSSICAPVENFKLRSAVFSLPLHSGHITLDRQYHRADRAESVLPES
jgi:hypothetical protein